MVASLDIQTDETTPTYLKATIAHTFDEEIVVDSVPPPPDQGERRKGLDRDANDRFLFR